MQAEVVIWDLERAQGLVDRGLQRDANVVLHVLVQHIGKVKITIVGNLIVSILER